MFGALHLDVAGGGGAREIPDALMAGALLLVAAAVPFVLGAAVARRWRGSPEVLAGFGAGAMLLLAVDLVKESTVAAIPLPARGADLARLGFLLAVLAVGFVLPSWLPRRARGPAPGGASWIAFAGALGVGAHALGEGFVVGSEAHVAIFPGVLGALSFLLHKGFEGAAVGALPAGAPGARPLGALALAAALPAAAGALAGALLGPTLLGPAAFALGAGAAGWILLELARRGTGAPKVYAAAAAGAVAVLLAGVLHAL